MTNEQRDSASSRVLSTDELGVDDMKITHEGVVADVRFLQERCEGFNDGTGDHFHTPFIHDLLQEVFRASGIALDTPAEQRYAPESSA